jgi:hypothetical protein
MKTAQFESHNRSIWRRSNLWTADRLRCNYIPLYIPLKYRSCQLSLLARSFVCCPPHQIMQCSASRRARASGPLPSRFDRARLDFCMVSSSLLPGSNVQQDEAKVTINKSPATHIAGIHIKETKKTKKVK